jgi:HlyD family secretion protein
MTLNTDQVTNFVVKIRVNPDSYSDLIKPNKAYPFRPGMSASVDIYTNTVTDVLSVPLIAVTTREKKEVVDKDEKDTPEAKKVALTNMDIKEIVFVLSGDTVGIKEVKTGIQDNDYIQVSGLNEGDKVVTGPYSAVSRKLEGGKKVNIVDKEDLKKKAEKN